ncbi:peptidyl-tRNA hydrolase [Kwoniella mangroviensis CBS 10435]|uniref:peptidyl-tRNA hydrolase n=1 Tax=Kwoniella mangroviensis CBS 10435 TaxID=1331196 RepID=A0A1B9J1E4_9TREE|nr:peptidyl-tRNA hydrolase [Kwoniella mangroviensis CBS 8507]OCF61611.1 peptidyl-tRNA hydrolase [Kwoniella mangroviensis CBS 10435]OCF63464.1 peptidyl-tRNA hydrolase [Kwoniella mangroviensis CBS 8507]OCF77633.1 peptidyl-tRNA hydrolase [Kwoniella mangroviensis CBS 8886]
MSSIRMDGILSPLVISVIAFAVGYQAHSLLSTRANPSLLTPTDASSKSKSRSKNDTKSVTSSSGSGTDTESDAEDTAAALSSDLTSTKFSSSEEMKLVLVVNDELKMTKGKIAAQAGHATLACAMTLKEANPRLFRAWQNQGQPKIALRCANTEELEILAAQARSLNLCARTIRDAGRTQVAPGSKTIVGIGPGPARIINTVTGKLKLL